MANELNQITVDTAGTSWVDPSPAAVSTGYQAQNTNIQARSVGQDLSSVRVSGTDIIVDISGPIDVDGLPFSLTSAVTLTPSSGGVFYIQVVAGATSIQKSLELTATTPVWDASKNALYNGTNRVLNWVVTSYVFGTSVVKIPDPQYINTSLGSTQKSDSSFSFVRWADISPLTYPLLKSSFSTPSGNCFGLAYDGTNLLSCDIGTDLIYIHDGITSSVLSSFASPSTAPAGLAFDGTNLISCDADASRIYIHDGITSSVLSSFASPGSSIRGIAFDGTNLISCDSGTNLIYIHAGITSSISSSFSAPASGTAGITFDGTNLISGDTSTDQIYIHDGISSSIISSFSAPSTLLTNMTFSGTNLISCDSGTDLIYIHGL